MASIKWSGLVSEVKGKLNGSILSVGYGGQVIRNRRAGGGVSSPSWSRSRARLALIAGRWRNLTRTRQDEWAAAGSSFPYTNKFGDPVTPSGYQLQSTLNSNLNFLGFTLLTSPPTPRSMESIGTLDFYQPATQELYFEWTASPYGYQEVVFYLSAPVSSGVVTPPRFKRFIGFTNSLAFAYFDATAAYIAVFGQIPTSGRIFCKVDLIDNETGQRWTYLESSVDLI